MINSKGQGVYVIKTTRNRRIFLQLPMFFFVVILLSCNKELGKVSAPDTPSFSLPLPTTETPSRPTIKPSIAATITHQVTQTPVDTLPVEIQKQNLIELISTNGGCDFPCWWGIRSDDPIQKVSDLAPVIGKSPRLFGSFYYYSLSLDDLNAPDFDVNFHVDTKETVQRIEVSLNQPSRFRDYHDAFEARLSLASLLKHHGKPSEVWFLITPRFEPGETPRPYTLFLLYSYQDFGIVYSGRVDSENPLRVCSIKLDDHHLQYIMLYLQNPRSKIAEINRSNSSELQPLEQVTSMSLDDFYRVFSEPKTKECIEVSVDVWQ